MKMIISIILGGCLWMLPVAAMDEKKAASLAAVKEPAPNRRKLSFLGFTIGSITTKGPQTAQVTKNSDIKTSKKLTAKQIKAEKQYPTLDAYFGEHDEMSTRLTDSDQFNDKYKLPGNRKASH